MTLFILVAISLLILAGCPGPMSPGDSAQRNFDLEAPVEPSQGGAPTADPYDTTPEWTWTPSGQGVDVFRVRLNGGDWTLLPPSVHAGVYTYPNPAIDYYPGTYVFEVQERDGAGNWSETTSQTTIIKVREPSFTAQPSSDIQTQNPAFGWDPYTPAQFGATGRYAFQLERDETGEWIVIESESQNDTTAVAYTVGAPLPDGEYRFGVAEWNAGGARSDFTYATFRVDTTPPGVPSVSGPSIVSDSNPGPSVFTPVPNSGDTVSEYVWEVIDSGAVQVASGTTPAGGTISVPLSAGSGGPGVGNYQLLVAQTDLAGNTGANAAYAVTVEEIPFLGYSGPNPVSSNTPTFDVTGAASLTTFFDWVINGVPQNAPFDSGVAAGTPFTDTPPVLADGTYTISIRQQRPYLSYSTPANAISITVDTVAPPAPTVVSGPPAVSNGASFDFTVSGEGNPNLGGQWNWRVFDSQPIVRDIATPANTADPATFTVGPLTQSNLAQEGELFTLHVSEVDPAGNLGPERIVQFTVDTTPPPAITMINVPDLLGTVPDQVTYNLTPSFSWSGSGQSGATWEYTLDGGTTWNGPIATESVTVGPLAVANDYQFAVREIDSVGNVGPTGVTITFDVLTSGSSTITINNPGVPTFSMDTGPFTLDVGGNAGAQTQIISITTGETLDAQTWFINGTQVGTAATYTVDAGTDPALTAPLVYGTNTLTLVVEIGGLPYSDDFLFTVEDN